MHQEELCTRKHYAHYLAGSKQLILLLTVRAAGPD